MSIFNEIIDLQLYHLKNLYLITIFHKQLVCSFSPRSEIIIFEAHYKLDFKYRNNPF